MRDLIRAELLKLRTTRMFWANVASALTFVPVGIALAVTGGTDSLDSGAGVRHVMAAASSGAVMLLVIGILITAGEFRHGTATSTFLISPDRRRVVAAKLVAASLVGAAVAVVAALLTLAIGLPWLAAEGVSPSAYTADVVLALLGSFGATVLGAVVGVGFGALVRNQTAAITVALVWTQVVEGLLVGFAPEVGKWFPGGAASALAGVSTPNGDLLPMGGAAVLVAAYGLAFAVAGTATLVRRDIA
jgi:ABC-type transport system involved in multi-copper enzyme maturation permease subunit